MDLMSSRNCLYVQGMRKVTSLQSVHYSTTQVVVMVLLPDWSASPESGEQNQPVIVSISLHIQLFISIVTGQSYALDINDRSKSAARTIALLEIHAIAFIENAKTASSAPAYRYCIFCQK